MEYKDIKTADELESWYAEKEDILEGHVRDYAVPFGNVYHLDSPGYVSEERWCDTLPSDRERSTFMALQNGVSTKEIIEHKDEFGWIDRMAMSSVADDYAECYMTQAGPDYLDEQEIMNVREQYPELIDSNGEIVWNDPDFMKRGVTFDVENFGRNISSSSSATVISITAASMSAPAKRNRLKTRAFPKKPAMQESRRGASMRIETPTGTILQKTRR